MSCDVYEWAIVTDDWGWKLWQLSMLVEVLLFLPLICYHNLIYHLQLSSFNSFEDFAFHAW